MNPLGLIHHVINNLFSVKNKLFCIAAVQ